MLHHIRIPSGLIGRSGVFLRGDATPARTDKVRVARDSNHLGSQSSGPPGSLRSPPVPVDSSVAHPPDTDAGERNPSTQRADCRRAEAPDCVPARCAGAGAWTHTPHPPDRRGQTAVRVAKLPEANRLVGGPRSEWRQGGQRPFSARDGETTLSIRHFPGIGPRRSPAISPPAPSTRSTFQRLQCLFAAGIEHGHVTSLQRGRQVHGGNEAESVI